MTADVKQIDSNALRNWLAEGKEVSILDIRPIGERAEWFIPGSIYFNAYDKLKANNPNALQGLHLNKTVPVVTICAGGKTSMIAASILQEQGFDAYSLQGGMKGWSLAWNTAKISFPGFDVIQFRRTGKGCLSYIIISGNEAIAVDASLPIEVYRELLKKESLTLKHVIETHIHTDHLSRSKQLADSNSVVLHLPVPNKVKFDFEAITGKTVFESGSIKIKVIETPGHTPESISLLIDDKIILTGDTLFTNGVGRPDLKSNQSETLQKAKSLYYSLQKIVALDENIIVLPSHTNKPVDFDNYPIQSTIGQIKNGVPLLSLSEHDFIQSILERIPATPANYLSITELNITGNFNTINPVDIEAGPNRCAIS